VLTKDQLSAAADAITAGARATRERQELSRLESRYGVKPAGMSLEDFRRRCATSHGRLVRSPAFIAVVVLSVSIIAAACFSRSGALVVTAIPACVLAVRQTARRVTWRLIRDEAKGDA